MADLISLPFHNNPSLDRGPDDDTRNVLDIQPVIPVHPGAEWQLRLQIQLLVPK